MFRRKVEVPYSSRLTVWTLKRAELNGSVDIRVNPIPESFRKEVFGTCVADATSQIKQPMFVGPIYKSLVNPLFDYLDMLLREDATPVEISVVSSMFHKFGRNMQSMSYSKSLQVFQ